VALATVAALQQRRHGGTGRWGAAAFAALAAILVVATTDPESRPHALLTLLLCLLIALPYLLLRFTEAFGVVGRPVRRGADLGLISLLLATLLLPGSSGDSVRVAWGGLFTVAVVLFWTTLSIVIVRGLWRLGRGQPTLPRRRTRVMSGAIATMNLLVLLLAVGAEHEVSDLLLQALLLPTLIAFGIGFAPPLFIRLMWRQPEQDALRRATEELARATLVPQVLDTLLPHVTSIVGGRGAAVFDLNGRSIASYGTGSTVVAPASEGRQGMAEVIALSPPFGFLVVTTGPLTPFFGHEEVRLLHSLAALADLSLGRCLLTERDRESQSALREAMETAERANLAKSEFLSRMSHELRTPLNVVLGFSQILEMKGSLDEEDTEAVEHILKAGHHLLGLINEVLDLSRIESGRMAISPEPVQVGGLVEESLDLIRPLADERSVRLASELSACERYVTADRQRLKQVLLNLLSNAVKYNRDGGEVAVFCGPGANGRLRLSVRDTGPGIPTRLLDRLFEPFERLGADNGPVEGTGLGLALSRQFVELMGGEIGVETGEGEGSLFWVELEPASCPQEDTGDSPELAHATASPDHPPRRLLLIEDNLANLKVLQSVMSRRPDVELMPAITGGMGLELARKHEPDLILLDQHLPDLSGTDVLHRLKADPVTRAIPVIVVTADATPRRANRMLDLGATDYLTKPLDLPTFLRAMDAALLREVPET